MTSSRERLLVATPALLDPNFARTVIFVLEHDDNGALGVVLNRPAETQVGEPLPGWDRLAADPGVMFLGGPVAQNAAVCLGEARIGASPDDWSLLRATVGSLDLSQGADAVAIWVARVRIFAGYAGWGARQLDAEIMLGSWYVVDASVEDIFSAEPIALWRRVLRRQGGGMAIAANAPLDPSLN